MALAFTLALFFREGFRILRKVAAENHRGRPEIADQIGAYVPCQDNRGHREREQREENVVLERLPDYLTSNSLKKRKLSRQLISRLRSFSVSSSCSPTPH